MSTVDQPANDAVKNGVVKKAMVRKALAKTAAETALADIFSTVKSTLPGDGGVKVRREEAFERFVAQGLPHRRVESWHYTDLRTLLREAAPLAEQPDVVALGRAARAGASLASLDVRRLYMVNGFFADEISDLSGLEEGLTIRPLSQALSEGDAQLAAHLGRTVPSDDAALALNMALMSDGLVVHVAAGAQVQRPLAVIHVTTGDAPMAVFTRSLVVLEQGAGLSLIETHEGPDGLAYQVNTALELVVGEEARLSRVKLTHEGDAALHVSSVLMSVAARARPALANFNSGGAVVRNQTMTQLAGESIDAWFGGVSLLNARQQTDTLLEVEHQAPGSESRENFRAVLDGAARDSFQGRIVVKQAAQKTDARMMSRALLLSDRAEANNKPELEIFADDVQCAHGCTTGELDQQVKFYLMARGIPEKEAEALLIQAFVGEVLEGIAHEDLRAVLSEATRNWLRKRGEDE
ncbi:Fe-S cluster assembly protein SufD [Xanthobacter sp. TB0139]|uniref:Fe-S cluster assembly protein SufD n=1 Tax=Xanthobacter sp. TB0139 TaxID=3459178 RepID=UPI004039ED7F